MSEGWLTDHERYWSMHFHRDCRSWVRDPLVFVDLGRAMADGSPALLKRRQHLPLSEAQALWRSLESSGWRQTAPVWGGRRCALGKPGSVAVAGDQQGAGDGEKKSECHHKSSHAEQSVCVQRGVPLSVTHDQRATECDSLSPRCICGLSGMTCSSDARMCCFLPVELIF